MEPNLAEAHSALGYIAFLYDWAWEEAEGHFTQALQTEPGNAQALAWYAELLMSQGRVEEAVELASRAAEIDPHHYSTRTTLTAALWNSGDLRAAEQEIKDLMEILPHNPAPHFQLAFLYRHVGRTGELTGLLDGFIAAMGGPNPEIEAALPPLRVFWQVPEDDTQRQEAVNTVRTWMAQTPRHSISYMLYASLLAGFGALDQGLEAVRTMVAARSPFVPTLNSRMISRSFRHHPDYIAILDDLGLPRPSAQPESERNLP